MTLGERLQNLLKGNMLSQEKVAELVGVSRQAVSK
jgi:transcriptional regulator with XRE-family HTH domain